MGWIKRKTESSQTPDYSQYGTVAEEQQYVRVQVPIDNALVEAEPEELSRQAVTEPEPAPAPVSYHKMYRASKVMDVVAPWEVSQPREVRAAAPVAPAPQPRFLPDVAPSY